MQLTLALLMVLFCVLYLALQIWRFWRRRGESPCSRCRHAPPADQGPGELVQVAMPGRRDPGGRNA